jgi:glycosyltransferase involved in cell wall biosynthesis
MGSAAAIVSAFGVLVRTVKGLKPKILQGWMYHGNTAATLAHYVCGGRSARKLAWNLRASNMDAARYGRTLRLGALLSGLPEMIIINSEAGAAFHRSHGFHDSRFCVIDNGVDTEKFRPDPSSRAKLRADLGIASDAVVAIHVARVDPMKDHATFLSAMARTPAVVGLLVGSGTQSLSLPANVKALGLRNDVARLLPAADVIASTSAFGEGFSNAIAEGMSAGLIPVATDVGDARRIVGDTGTVVPPGDPAAFSRAMVDMAAMPAAARTEKGGNARERIISQFALASAIDAYFNLYRGMIAAPQS